MAILAAPHDLVDEVGIPDPDFHRVASLGEESPGSAFPSSRAIFASKLALISASLAFATASAANAALS